jgi:hypothetical protein
VNANWAEENLKTIRNLMEHAGLYRRAMAPVAIIVGVLGLAAAVFAQVVGWTDANRFASYWMGVGVISMLSALLLIRSQALKGDEKFWSPPTRRVAQAMAPMLAVGLGLGLLELLHAPMDRGGIRLASIWMILYGGAVHSAGFFMQRGLRLLGWIFVIIGIICLFISEFGETSWLIDSQAHWVMGWAFGVNNLAYGLYLKLTAEPLETE